jgi:hypothetical protein
MGKSNILWAPLAEDDLKKYWNFLKRSGIFRLPGIFSASWKMN